MKKILLFTLIICLIFSLSTGVHAIEPIQADSSIIDAFLTADIAQMTKDELNLYIDQIAEYCQTAYPVPNNLKEL